MIWTTFFIKHFHNLTTPFVKNHTLFDLIMAFTIFICHSLLLFFLVFVPQGNLFLM